MSPDLDAGLLHDDAGTCVGRLGGRHLDRHLDREARHPIEHESVASVSSSLPVPDPSALHGVAPAYPRHAADPLAPDDFYEGHRARKTDAGLRHMTPSSPPRSTQLPGDASSARPRPAADYAVRTGSRTASNPLDSKPAGPTLTRAPTGKPSVKDLKKRFDQNGADPPSVPRPPLRQGAAPLRTTRSTGKPANGTPGLSAGASLDPPMQPVHDANAATRPQWQKHAAQGTASASSQSFASRIGRPRSSVNGKPIASKSMTHIPQKPLPRQPSSSPPAAARSPELLFGEIPPGHSAASVAGFGIHHPRPRKASESHQAGPRRRFSGPDVESPSPSSWYRQVDTLRDQPDGRMGYHARSRSDASAPLTAASLAYKPLPKTPTGSGVGHSPSASKLPVSVRMLSSPVSSPSPNSTRSNSPSTLRCSLANIRIPGVNFTATAPSAVPAARAKTPTQTSAAQKPPPQALVTPDGHARLHPYTTAPSPKLSPPLRSSRPRLPVSAAATAGSRAKETDGAASRDRPFLDTDDGATGRRKLSVGPIDFEQRREHIRLAYSKSIRESEALEARQFAAESKQEQELDTAAEADQISAEAFAGADAGAPPSGASGAAGVDEETEAGPLPRQPVAEPGQLGARLSADAATQPAADMPIDALARPAVSLTLCTTLGPGQQVARPRPANPDSPTLGVPGSFPAPSSPSETEEQPLSAVSAASETTEFDVEPQTNPPIHAQSPLGIAITIVKPPSPPGLTSAHPQVTYRYPFDEEPDALEQLSMGSRTPQEAHQPIDAADERLIVDAFEDKLARAEKSHSGHQSLGAVVTILPAEAESEDVENASTVPFPRLDAQDDQGGSDCDSDLEHAARGGRDARLDDVAVMGPCAGETDDHERVGYGEANFRLEEPPSVGTSTCASSDAGALDGVAESSRGQSRSPADGSALAVPFSRPPDDRLSRQSTWTDLSIDTTDPSDTARSSAMQSRHDSPSFGHVTIFESRTPAPESRSPLRDASFPPSGTRDLDDAKTSSTHANQAHLPEVDTGDFFVPYLSPVASTTLSFLPSPDHEPPPIPNSTSGSALNSRTSSVFYDQSYYGSTLVNSEKEADEYVTPLETPLSMDMPTPEVCDQDLASGPTAGNDAKPAAQEEDGKERHRLVQRRNVIKELIDTEAVFVRDMNIVEEIYKGTAEACPELDSKTVKLIFRNSDEIIHFHTHFLRELKDAVASVYIPVSGRSSMARDDSLASEQSQGGFGDPSDGRDRATSLGFVFQGNVENLKLAHEGFLRNSDQAAKRLIQIQQDPTVKVWLNECNEVAKDLTAAWDLDSLLIKPMQRITKYPNLIITLLQHTPQDHPDREALVAAKESLETAIIEINRTKKNFELVGQIVGRKRKESDVKAGFARAFGKRVDKLQASNNRPREDQDYVKLNEKFGDDYLRLQVVLRDVEYYTRQVAAYVHEFLQYLSSIELVMRFQPGNYPELESKWVQFNISVRDLEKVALEEHLTQVRKQVIEPFELVIKAYGNPSLAMKKRQKRRLDYERSEQLKRAGRTADPKLRELVEQYEALNDTLKKELPALSALTEKVGNICLGNFVTIQTRWFDIWKDKMKTVLGECGEMPDLQEVVSTFQRDHPYVRDQLAGVGMLSPGPRARMSQSMSSTDDGAAARARGRGLSVNGDAAPMLPMLPTPEFGDRRSGPPATSAGAGGSGSGTGPSGSGNTTATAVTAMTATTATAASPHQYYYRDYYSGIQVHQGAGASPRSPEMGGSSRSLAGTGAASTRPSTSRSIDSGGLPRPSLESANQAAQRDSSTTCNSSHGPHESRRYSGMFHSALPLPDGPEDSRRSSRASSRERGQTWDGYRVLWLAASLFEFNIATTKHEAGYPYLTYQAGEIFDVVAEKGELWLAKNQDDATNRVGWIWSKHFAKLADW